MTKWQLDREGGPWDYPTLGFSATDGAIIDGSLSNPVMTTAPDVFWTEYVGGSAETGVTRWGEFVHPPAPAEPTAGSMLLYDVVANRWAPTTAAEAVDSGTEFGAALSATIEAAQQKAPIVHSASGLARFRKALQTATTARVPVIFQGDSITAGAWADGTGSPISEADAIAWAADGYVGKVREFAHSIYGDLGEGLITLATEEARWTLTGTNTQKPWGVGSTGRRWTTEGTATGDFEGTGYDVMGIRRNGGVGSGQPLTRGGVPFLKVDGTDVTPNAISGSPVSGVAAMTAGWAGDGIAYSVESGENIFTTTSTGAGGKTWFTPLSTGNRFAVTAGDTLLVTVEAQPVGAAGKSNYRVGMRFFDASNVQVGADLDANTGAIPGDVWSPVTHVLTVPANAVTAGMLIKHSALAASEVSKYRRAKVIPLQFATAATGDGAVSTGTDATIYRYGVDGLTDASHEVQLVTSGGTCDVIGIRARKGDVDDPGIPIHRAGRSGSATVEHVGAGWSTATKADLLVTTYEAVEETPALVVIALGANDWNRQDSSTLPPATFKTHITTLVTKATGLGASVMLLAEPRWEDDSKTYSQQDYADALLEVAQENDHVAFFDLRQMWGDYAAADAAGLMYDSPHPNAAGHASLARQVRDIVLG